MDTHERVLHRLKRQRPASEPELAAALALGAGATRHHLQRLERDEDGRSRTSVAAASACQRDGRATCTFRGDWFQEHER